MNGTEAAQPVQFILVSGMSGSGKSVALGALEDLGYYCVDNLPPSLIPAFIQTVLAQPDLYRYVAIGVDARSRDPELGRLTGHLDDLEGPIEVRTLFLNADDATLLRRFSETRRRHPMTTGSGSLTEAIADERHLLDGLRRRGDWIIDTSDTNVHQLRRQIWKSVASPDQGRAPTLVLESFAFKRGVPGDLDLLFDARCLPNPYWDPALRDQTGRHPPVIEFLQRESRVQDFLGYILDFLRTWLPHYNESQRSYFTIGLGCTGGQHRSVYLVEQLSDALKADGHTVVVHHRELDR